MKWRESLFWKVFILGFLLLWPLALAFGQEKAVQNGATHDGQEVACDIPDAMRVHNTIGINGAGLCVWASTEMAARYQQCKGMVGIFDHMKSQLGGGWPSRVDAMMKRYAPETKYRQFVGGGDEGLAFIKQAIDSGRPCCVTYGYGELYGGRTIAHMVLCVALDDEWAAILDNNDEHHIWWMSAAEFRKRFLHPRGQGWAWYTFAPPPPPVPHN